MKVAVAATALALIAYGPAHAQELWRGLRVGMTADQVRAALPEAKVNPKPDPFADGAKADLIVDGFEVNRLPTTADLVFLNGTLLRVRLNLQADENLTRFNLARAAEVAGLLEQKYGKPYACGDESLRNFASYRCAWKAKGIEVSVSYLDIAGGLPLLTVLYSPADPSLDENL
jgi:hypothetical protein